METKIKRIISSLLFALVASNSLAMERKGLHVEIIQEPHFYACQTKTFFDIRCLKNTLTGDLRLVRDEHGRLFALKKAVLSKRWMALEDPIQELAIMQKLRATTDSNHLVSLVDFHQDDDQILMVLPLANRGDSFDYLMHKKVLPIQEIRRISHHLALAVGFLHKNNIAHLDISPENCLLNRDADTGLLSLMLADLGVAQFINKEPFSAQSDPPGKNQYMAPELLDGSLTYDPKAVDIWSMGNCFYVFATVTSFVAAATPHCSTFEYFRTEGLRPLLKYKSTHFGVAELPENLIDLLEEALKIDPKERSTIRQVLDHVFFQAEET